MSLLRIAILFLFSATLVRSNQIIGSLKSFKSSKNVTYDCVDIYKQPSLNHSLLKTHKIQMKPSISRPESKNHVWNEAPKMKRRCQDGTVPIMRNTKEYISNAKRLEEMHFNPLTDSPGNTHMAGVRSTSGGPYHGVEGEFISCHLKIAKDQASYAFIYLGTETNFIQAGWMINPGIFGDQNVWSYGFWRGKNEEGCYNVNCPGFVQVSKEHPIGEPGLPSRDIHWHRMSIHQDKRTGNWWLSKHDNVVNVKIGYWPKELFDFMKDDAKRVGAAGAVQASLSGACPPMGNGERPNEDPSESHPARFTNVAYLDSNYQQRQFDHSPITPTINGEKCYGLKYSGGQKGFYGFCFSYGGPGGMWC